MENIIKTIKPMKTLVLDLRTADWHVEECGDFVTCSCCGKIMFVDCGTEECPECGKKSLSWVDKENQENRSVSDAFFEDNEKYLLTDSEDECSFINEIHSTTPISDNFVEVDLTSTCAGVTTRKTKLFEKRLFEDALKDGCYF